MQSRERWLFLLYAVLVVLFGISIFQNSIATPSVRWCFQFSERDFPNLASVGPFLKELRVQIPPLLSILEITALNVFGSFELVTVFIYRVAFVACYVFALICSRSSVGRTVSFILGIVFMWGTQIMHVANPMVYDLIFPALVLGYIIIVDRLELDYRERRRQCSGIAFLAGLSLSVAELTRPFVVFILPVLIYLVVLICGDRKTIFCFLLPIILFSGGWHGYQAVKYQTLTWGNQSGFNLIRALPEAYAPGRLKAEPGMTPRRPELWQNLNTREHSENDKILKSMVVSWALNNPGLAISKIINRLSYFLIILPVVFYDYHPKHFILFYYQWLIRGAVVYLFFDLLTVFFRSIKDPAKISEINIISYASLRIVTGFSILVLAIGDVGEESRFILEVLPFLACIYPLRGAQKAKRLE